MLTLIIGSIIVCLGMISNSLVIASSFESDGNSKKCLLKTMCFIRSLAVTDLFCMLLMVGYMVYILIPNLQTRFFNNLITSLHIFFCCCSQLHNMMIILERTVAVVSPVFHRVVVTSHRAQSTIVCIWILSGMLFVIAFLRHPFPVPIFRVTVFWLLIVIAFIIPLLVIIPGLCIIGFIGYKSVKVKQRNCRYHALNRELRWQELKVIGHISVMVAPMVICWTVFFVGTIYETVSENYFSGVMNWVLTFLPFVASAVNPLMYILVTRSLMTGVKRRVRYAVKYFHPRNIKNGFSSIRSPSAREKSIALTFV